MNLSEASLADQSMLPACAVRRRLLRLAPAPALLLFGMGRASAHHGWSSFDSDKPIYVEGTVKTVRWQNPHAEIVIDLKPGLKLPPDLAGRKVPGQTQQVDGTVVLAKAKPPSNPATSWTLELAPLFRVEAWKVAQPAAGATVAAIGYAPPGEKTAMMRVEYLLVDGKMYGLRSMPTE
jgi:Family of unknown function (DUF6152)